MKMMKKVVALMMALAMVLVMGASFATSTGADMNNEAGVIGEFAANGTPTAQGNTVVLYKEITAFNPDETSIYAPAISYTYAVTAGTAGSMIDDNHSTNGTQALVKAGLNPTAVTVTDVSWTNANTLAANTIANGGAANRKTLTVDFSNVSWAAPADTAEADRVKYGAGVYRYVINESLATGSSYPAAGVVDGGSHTRYLDVYVKDATSGGYEIYGYVCSIVGGDIDGANANVNANAFKTEGFVAATGVNADQYYTNNLIIGKEVVNDQMMNGNKFPFTVAFANTAATGTFQLKTETTGTAQVTNETDTDHLTAAAMSSIEAGSPAIAHGGTVKYIGLPVGTTATVKETNNVTGTTYLSSYSLDKKQTYAGSKTIYTGVESETATMAATAQDDAVIKTVDFKNELSIISPTGYVARIAPYALMLAAGIVLLVLFVKRRKPATEDDE